MAILKSCCCWKTVRSGSFASGVFTMTFYSVVVIAGSFHVHSILNSSGYEPVILMSSLLLLGFSASSVLSSILLIVGLYANNRLLLLPWIFVVSMTTILDVILSLYLITVSPYIDPFFAVLLVTDFFICALNVYCILCVTSQYQEYMNGRGRPGQVMVDDMLPAIHFEPASCAERNGPGPKVTVSLIQNGNRGSSTCCLLAAPTSTTSGLLSRSSISSEGSFSSDPGSSSRRGSLLLTSRERSDSTGSNGRAVLPILNHRRGLHLVADVTSVCPDDQSEIIVVEENDGYANQIATTAVFPVFRNGSVRSLGTYGYGGNKFSPKRRSVTSLIDRHTGIDVRGQTGQSFPASCPS